jgi:hypothetical protein
MLKKCLSCGLEFKTSHVNTKYCSQQCFGKVHSQKMAGEGNSNYKGGGTCKFCGRNIYKGKGYCSKKCYRNSLPDKVELECQYCHEKFFRKPSESTKSKYCSQKCRNNADSKNFSQKNHWNWQGGITKYSVAIRNSRRYDTWRNDVLNRDNHTCRLCGTSSGILHAHHLTPFPILLKLYSIKSLDDALNNEDIWDIRHGATLCISCHRQTFKHR